jgi:hypothetical protein
MKMPKPIDQKIKITLAETQQAKDWLAQFAAADRKTAKRLLDCLTLVSHSEFERGLTQLVIEESEKIESPVALYAVKEQDPRVSFFQDATTEIDAVDRGSDLGSEARVAAIVRNLAKAHPKKYLNHPTLKRIKDEKCRAIIALDDFIGSGERTTEFLASMWLSATLRSWHSYKLTRFLSLAYSGTTQGVGRVNRTRSKPTVFLHRSCPTFSDIPWSQQTKEDVIRLCEKYGRKTSDAMTSLGFDDTMATIVFEHGCPDNAPAILWSDNKSKWRPLFPNRVVMPKEASAFPDKIAPATLAPLLIEIGQNELALSNSAENPTPLKANIITVLGLAASGFSSRAAIAYATGTSVNECGLLLDECVRRGFLTHLLRLTRAGKAEIKSVIGKLARNKGVPSKGTNEYYPRQLRGP